MSKILDIVKNSVCFETDCKKCLKSPACEYKIIAKALEDAGAVVPILCKDCKQFDPDLGICKIRYDSWSSVLERGPHDWCSDGDRKDE